MSADDGHPNVGVAVVTLRYHCKWHANVHLHGLRECDEGLRYVRTQQHLVDAGQQGTFEYVLRILEKQSKITPVS